MDRRTTIKWMLAASAVLPALSRGAAALAGGGTQGYGTDPNLVALVHAGEFWPLTLSAAQRRLVAVLADIIIPADDHSPSASAVGVVDFIDEWVSAPYPDQQADRPIIVAGLAWLDAEAQRRQAVDFANLASAQQHAICDAIAYEMRVIEPLREQARFFARFRDLAAGGFYCTAAGRKDLDYIGNVALARFVGPDAELLRSLGLI
jgi:hypothetical protein